jgi:hypothetical protein
VGVVEVMTAAWRRLRRVPPLAWGIGAGLLALPFYLRYFAWVVGSRGLEFWMPPS